MGVKNLLLTYMLLWSPSINRSIDQSIERTHAKSKSKTKRRRGKNGLR
jgi:hypothetical protein